MNTTQAKTPPLVINNGKVALAKDLVFGWCVHTEGECWFPVSQLDAADARNVFRLMDYSRLFPEDAMDAVRKRFAPA